MRDRLRRPALPPLGFESRFPEDMDHLEQDVRRSLRRVRIALMDRLRLPLALVRHGRALSSLEKELP